MKNIVKEVLGADYLTTKDGIIHFEKLTPGTDETYTQHQMSDFEFMYWCKEYITNYENHMGICSHKTFYTQFDGRHWYAGFSHIHTTYSDKITYNDIAKAKTEILVIQEATKYVVKAQNDTK